MKNANIFEPNGIRLELNELMPESLTKKATDAWGAAQESKKTSLMLSVVGIAVKDYPESQEFLREDHGLPRRLYVPQRGWQTNDNLLSDESRYVPGNAAGGRRRPSGLTHLHLLTDDLNASIARLRQAGLPAASGNAPAPGTLGVVANVSPDSHVKNVNVFDPDGIRLELNEYIPESLTKKASDSWK